MNIKIETQTINGDDIILSCRPLTAQETIEHERATTEAALVNPDAGAVAMAVYELTADQLASAAKLTAAELESLPMTAVITAHGELKAARIGGLKKPTSSDTP